MSSQGTDAAKRPRSRRWWLLLGVVGALIVGWLVYTTVNILNPSQGDLDARSDAVVTLAPQYHRLPTAQQLIEDGVADTLVISYFDHDPLNSHLDPSAGSMPLRDYCEAEVSHAIVCFTPEENATIGEAYAIAELGSQRSWDSLTVVTDTTHVFRTRYIVDRCLGDDFQLNVVVADRELSAAELAWHTLYENAALVKAMWQVAGRC